jgi:FkbM family methyltransferase
MLPALLRSLFGPGQGPQPEGEPVAAGVRFSHLALGEWRYGLCAYNRNDRYIGRSLEVYGEYSELETRFLAQWLRPDDVVVEAGANIGPITVPLARAVGPGGRVFAYEPQRLVFQLLCCNLALNELGNVVARPHALGGRAGTARVPAIPPSAAHNFGGVALAAAGAEGEPVAVERIDDLGLAACRLVKIDVEGMETEVLEGARATIARVRPLLYVENDRAERSPALIGLVQSLGYRAFWHLPPLFNPANFAGRADNLFGNIVSVNLFCVPAEAALRPGGLTEVAGPDDTWTGKPMSLDAPAHD